MKRTNFSNLTERIKVLNFSKQDLYRIFTTQGIEKLCDNDAIYSGSYSKHDTISFTRDKNYLHVYGMDDFDIFYEYQICFDTDKLEQRYKIKPYADYSKSHKREKEELLYAKKVPDVHKYIKWIEEYKTRFTRCTDNTNLNRRLASYCKKYGIPLKLYNELPEKYILYKDNPNPDRDAWENTLIFIETDEHEEMRYGLKPGWNWVVYDGQNFDIVGYSKEQAKKLIEKYNLKGYKLHNISDEDNFE